MSNTAKKFEFKRLFRCKYKLYLFTFPFLWCIMVYSLSDGEKIPKGTVTIMDMKEKVMEICRNAIAGKCSAESFYDKLSAVADDTRTDDDLACIIEDGLMEIEMSHESSSKKALSKLIKETAESILEAMKR